MNVGKLMGVLRDLIAFYRQVGLGHSAVMLEGVKNSDRHPFVVVPNQSVRNTLVTQLSLKKFRPVTLDEIAHGSLRGVSGPMAWEHTALEYLFRDCLSTISELEADLREAKTQNEAKDDKIVGLIRDKNRLQNQYDEALAAVKQLSTEVESQEAEMVSQQKMNSP